jgi:hypothetical protein
VGVIVSSCARATGLADTARNPANAANTDLLNTDLVNTDLVLVKFISSRRGLRRLTEQT